MLRIFTHAIFAIYLLKKKKSEMSEGITVCIKMDGKVKV